MKGIKIQVKSSIKGKSPTQLSHELKKGLSQSRNKALEVIRQRLLYTAPSKQKGNRWSENKIKKYLSNPYNCIRKRGRFGGYVILDQNKLKHLKYVLHNCRLGSRIYPQNTRALKICYPKQPRGTICGNLYSSVKGHKGNDFLTRAYLSSRKWVKYITKKQFDTILK